MDRRREHFIRGSFPRLNGISSIKVKYTNHNQLKAIVYLLELKDFIQRQNCRQRLEIVTICRQNRFQLLITFVNF